MTAPADAIVIAAATTPAAMAMVVDIRRRVFGNEQRILLSRYEDPEDSFSFNVLAYVDGVAVGTGRLAPAFERSGVPAITWIATLPAYRRMGVGREIVRALVDEADARGYLKVYLNAQTYAQQLYADFGFQPVGLPQTIHGIRHQGMVRVLG
ncbi:GNAT family N-acetyltransferase [soil metagenome]